MTTLHDIIEAMEPAQALTALTEEVKKALDHLGEEARINFVTGLIDGTGEDKIASMVHL